MLVGGNIILNRTDNIPVSIALDSVSGWYEGD
jgi:hypothetical protein